MIIYQDVITMAIVSLSTVNDLEPMINKSDYTMFDNTCQTEQWKNTLEYNYITAEEFIKNNHKKYQDIIP
jgi:hypothetical protein